MGMQILVVDDEPAVRASLERALRLEGYDIALAADGSEALAALRMSGECPSGWADADGTAGCAGQGTWPDDPDGIAEPLINAARAAAAVDDGTGDDTGTTPTDSQADDGPALPSTGMDVGGLLVLGLATLALGAYLRRRTTPEPARPAGRIGW